MLLITTSLLSGMLVDPDHELSPSWMNPSTSLSRGEILVEGACDYWKYDDLKGLDLWGDSGSRDMDIVAIYEKEEPDFLAFRLDFLDLSTETTTPTHFALDFVSGGNTLVEPGNNAVIFDVAWDLMVSISGTHFTLYDSTFTEQPELLSDSQIDRQLDFVAFAVARDAFNAWDGGAFQMQAMATEPGNIVLLDKIAPVATDDIAGRAKLVLPFVNAFIGRDPSAVGWYDGFTLRPDDRPGERRGFRYLLDAVEEYEIPLTLVDLRLETLPANEHLRINERIRSLASREMLDPLTTSGYGHFMTWQPDDVDAKAIEITKGLRKGLELPVSSIYYPYQAMVTAGDIHVIQAAGFDAIFGYDQYRYWLGWINDWSDPVSVKQDIESLRKVHVINGMSFVFETRINNYQGFDTDERWEEINWDEYNEYEQYAGTDRGLHLWWRRILHDMAMDPDQEQFFTIGTGIMLTPWLFPDVVDWNIRWLASHPWIEVTTFSSILDRNWAVIDHGDLGLAPNELLIQHPLDGDTHYNAYFPQHYYGGTSDGHSPIIPAGIEIEGYYDYVPYLRDGKLIPSGRIMGDDLTQGSIVHETLQNLRAAPDNPLTQLAWLSYLILIGEQTLHNGPALCNCARIQANFLSHVNKIVYAANWAAEIMAGTLLPETQIVEQDLDLDGEYEYIMSNNMVLAIFENDGGRLEYAFAYNNKLGPVQLVSPGHQYIFLPDPSLGLDYTNGEVAILLAWPDAPDGAFVEDVGEDGKNEYAPYTASYDNDSLSFFLEDHLLAKTFSLEGDTIYAQYQIGSGEAIIHEFGLSVNMLGVFGKDWSETFDAIGLPGSLGWQMTSGGLALVNLEDTSFITKDSFSDSPARDEMREREDSSTYTSGHWYCFPCSTMTLYGVGSGELSLTLRSSPINQILLPIIVAK
jgi:hypothetical protein